MSPSPAGTRPVISVVAKPRGSRPAVSQVTCLAGPPMFNRSMMRATRRRPLSSSAARWPPYGSGLRGTVLISAGRSRHALVLATTRRSHVLDLSDKLAPGRCPLPEEECPIGLLPLLDPRPVGSGPFLWQGHLSLLLCRLRHLSLLRLSLLRLSLLRQLRFVLLSFVLASVHLVLRLFSLFVVF